MTTSDGPNTHAARCRGDLLIRLYKWAKDEDDRNKRAPWTLLAEIEQAVPECMAYALRPARRPVTPT